MRDDVRDALMRLTMCAREECDMCKYKESCGFDFQYEISTENMHTILNALNGNIERTDLISRAELFNRLATIHAPMEANDYKSEVYAVIQDMEALESNCDGCTIAGLAEAFAKDYMHIVAEKIVEEIRRNQNE